MTSVAGEALLFSKPRSQAVVITALGVTQIFAWGGSYHLLAVLATPVATETGWARAWVVGGVSIGLLTAGVASPTVGRAIASRGGRPVLAVSAGLLAGGLLALAFAHSLPAYLSAWLVIGLGMGAGLYDPAFATLGRLYGQAGRSAITTLTLFGGFASTVCWPLSAFLEAHLGWRGSVCGLCRLPALRRTPDLLASAAARAQTPCAFSEPSVSPNGRRGAAESFKQRTVVPPRNDNYPRFRYFNDAFCASTGDFAGKRIHTGCSRWPRGPCRPVSSRGQNDRNADRAISSSNFGPR